MTTRDIQDIVKELYDVDVSPTLISEITADLDAQVTAWRTRQLDPVWPIVYFDGIVVHVRGANGRVLAQTMYVALGVNMQGRKELLGLWLNETEGAKFWLSCLTDLKNRGLKDIFISCIDGLSGFAEALHTAYPQAKVQLCIVHLVRAALKYVVDKDSEAVITDLKKIYQAATVLEAEEALESFAQAWGEKYPTIVKQWRLKWPDIAAMFDFPPAIRKAIYTTNAIESVNSVIRKFTRNRKQYPNEESALKLVYLAIHEASKKWTMPIPKWRRGAEPLRHHLRGPIAGAGPELILQTPFPPMLTQKDLQGQIGRKRDSLLLGKQPVPFPHFLHGGAELSWLGRKLELTGLDLADVKQLSQKVEHAARLAPDEAKHFQSFLWGHGHLVVGDQVDEGDDICAWIGANHARPCSGTDFWSGSDLPEGRFSLPAPAPDPLLWLPARHWPAVDSR